MNLVGVGVGVALDLDVDVCVCVLGGGEVGGNLMLLTCVLAKGFEPVGQAGEVSLAGHLICLLLDGLPQLRTLCLKLPVHCIAVHNSL